MPDEDPILDWTDPRWPHTPTPRGIPYPILMSPSKAAKILDKAGKKGVIGGRGKARTKSVGKK